MRQAQCVVRGAWLPPRGFSLLEVMVVIVILGLIMGMSGMAFVSLRAPPESDEARELHRARREAIQKGRPVVTVVSRPPRTTHLLFLPDGRAIGDRADPLTGTLSDAAN